MSKIDGASPLIPTPTAKISTRPDVESAPQITPVPETATTEIETRSSLELEGPTPTSPPADHPLGGLTLPLLLQQLQMRINSIEKSGSTTEAQELYEYSQPIVQALRQSMSAVKSPAPPTPAAAPTTEITFKAPTPLGERNQAQIKRFELLYKNLELKQFSALLGFSGEPSKALQSVFLRLGRDIHTWSDLSHAIESSDLKVESYRALATYQAQVLLKAQPNGSTLFIANQPKDQSVISLAQEKELLQKQFKPEAFFSLEDPAPIEMDGFIQSGRFSQVWVSGHGVPGSLVLSNGDGETQFLAHQDFVDLLKGHPAVKEVVTNICSAGIGGDHSLIALLQQVGIKATGYEAPVYDSVALQLAGVIHKHVQAGKGIAQAVEDSFHEVYPKRQGFLETNTTAYGLPRYLVAASAKVQADKIGDEISGMVVRALEKNNPTALKRYLSEYPGLVNVFAWVTALQDKHDAQARELSIDYPELLLVKKDMDQRLSEDPQRNRLKEAVRSYVAWQFISGDKTFLEVGHPVQEPAK
jgi:hypothetical protein